MKTRFEAVPFPIVFSLVLIAIAVFAPLAGVYLVTNDDLKFSSAAREGFFQALSCLWALTRYYGRIHFAKMFSYYLPFAWDHFIWFKAVTLCALGSNLLLFAYFLRLVFNSRMVFYLSLLLSLICLQNNWDYSPITAFPGLFTFTLAYLLSAFILFIHAMRNKAPVYLYISAALYLLALLTYEMFIIYLPVFFLLAMHSGEPRGNAFKKILPHIAAAAIFLLSYMIFKHFRMADYPGATVAGFPELDRIWRVIWRFSKACLPGRVFFSHKYQNIIEIYQDIPCQDCILGSVKAIWIIKSLLVAGVYVGLMRHAEKEPVPILLNFKWLLLIGLLYFFLPVLPLSLTSHYQKLVIEQGQFANQVSYFPFYAIVFLLVLILFKGGQEIRKPFYRRLFIGFTTALIIATSLMTDYTNHYLAKSQTLGAGRWRIVDEFLKTPAYAAIPEGGSIYAPSLFAPVLSLDFTGTAIDFPPDAERYANYWTFYFTVRGGKFVRVVDSLENIRLGHHGFHYLRYWQENNGTRQLLVFANVIPETRTIDPYEPFLTDIITIFNPVLRESLMLGGRVASNQFPVNVSLSGNDSHVYSTSDLFLIKAADVNFLQRGHLKEISLFSDKPLLDPESIYAVPEGKPSFQMKKDSVLIKKTGWHADQWIGRTASMEIKTQQSANLVIGGFLPDFVFNVVKWDGLDITLRMNGVVLQTYRVDKSGLFRMDQKIPAGAEGVFTIECHKFFVPKDLKISDDPRELACVIHRVALE